MKSQTFVAFCLIVCWLGAGETSGQMDSLRIEGPKEVRSGDLVRLNAKLDENESPLWIVLKPSDLDYEQVDQGARLIFAVKYQQQEPITVMLLAQRVVEGRVVTRQVRTTLLIVGEDSPKPDPVDDNEPGQDFTASPLFGLTQKAWVQLNDRAKLKTESIAKNFESAAGLCESDAFAEPAQIWEWLSEANRNSLVDDVELWESVGVAFQKGFQQLKLTTPKQHIFHLRAIAAALRSKVK